MGKVRGRWSWLALGAALALVGLLALACGGGGGSQKEFDGGKRERDELKQRPELKFQSYPDKPPVTVPILGGIPSAPPRPTPSPLPAGGTPAPPAATPAPPPGGAG